MFGQTAVSRCESWPTFQRLTVPHLQCDADDLVEPHLMTSCATMRCVRISVRRYSTVLVNETVVLDEKLHVDINYKVVQI